EKEGAAQLTLGQEHVAAFDLREVVVAVLATDELPPCARRVIVPLAAARGDDDRRDNPSTNVAESHDAPLRSTSRTNASHQFRVLPVQRGTRYGVRGAASKSNAAAKSFAFASRSVSGSRPQRCSMVARIDVVS